MNLDQHIAKARRNWNFLSELGRLDRTFPEWSTVALHYCALHLIDAYLHGNGSDHGGTHGERARLLGGMVRARRMTVSTRDAYFRLASRSRVARYTAEELTAAEFTALVRDFRRIEAEVAPRLRLSPFARLPFEPES